MAITLTPEAELKVRRLLESGEFPNAAAVIDEALGALERVRRAEFERLREMLLEGYHSPPAGELTDEMWDEFERRAEARFLRGEKPDPDVCPRT